MFSIEKYSEFMIDVIIIILLLGKFYYHALSLYNCV